MGGLMLKGNMGLYRNGATYEEQPNGMLDGLSDATKAAIVHLGTGRRALKSYPENEAIVSLRRSSNNAVTDIGTLANGQINAAAAADFGGNANLFVATNYDQSGKGNNLTQSTTTAQPWLVITDGRASMLFDGTNDFYERQSSDFPENLHLMPTIGNSLIQGDTSTFDNSVGGWYYVQQQQSGSFSAVNGVAQLTGINNYSDKAIQNNVGVLGKNLVFELDVWSSTGSGVSVSLQKPTFPFDNYGGHVFFNSERKKVQLYLPNCPVNEVLLMVTPWSSNANMVTYFDNVKVHEVSPEANVGVTVATRITPTGAGAIWSMRNDNLTLGFLSFGRNTDGTLYLEHRNDAGNYSTVATSTTVPNGVTATVICRWDFVNQVATIRINGVTAATTFVSTRASPLTAKNHLFGATRLLGSRVGFFAGAMTPPIIINSHVSDSECRIIENALGFV